MLLATIPFVRRTISLRPRFDGAAWLALVRPTLTFALATTVGALYMYTALVLTSLVTSETETGLFAASFRVFAIVAAVPAILVSTAFPLLSRAARDDEDRLRYASQRLFEGSALLGGAALVGGVLGAAPIIRIIGGPQYLGAVDALQIQSVALALTFVIAGWGFTLLSMHDHQGVILANACAFVVSFVTVLVLAGSHGATGAAVGTLLGEATLATGYLIALREGARQMRPNPARVARLVPAAAIGLGALMLPVVPSVQAVVGLLAYGVCAFAFGGVPGEIREHLPGPLATFGPEGPKT